MASVARTSSAVGITPDAGDDMPNAPTHIDLANAFVAKSFLALPGFAIPNP